jgi:hypothetical protein
MWFSVFYPCFFFFFFAAVRWKQKIAPSQFLHIEWKLRRSFDWLYKDFFTSMKVYTQSSKIKISTNQFENFKPKTLTYMFLPNRKVLERNKTVQLQPEIINLKIRPKTRNLGIFKKNLRCEISMPRAFIPWNFQQFKGSAAQY